MSKNEAGDGYPHRPVSVLFVVKIDAFGLQITVFKPRGFRDDHWVHIVDEDQLLFGVHAHQLIRVGQLALRCRPCIALRDRFRRAQTTASRACANRAGQRGAEVPHCRFTAQRRKIFCGHAISRSEVIDHAGVGDEGLPTLAIKTLQLAEVLHKTPKLHTKPKPTSEQGASPKRFTV